MITKSATENKKSLKERALTQMTRKKFKDEID